MSFDKRNYAPDVPYLQGMRVCLNPETPDYRSLNQDAQGEAGHVIHSDVNETHMTKWKTYSPSTRADFYCTVEWDNGKRNMYTFHQLLFIDSEPIDTVSVRLESGSNYYGLVDKTYQVVDKQVFEYGEGVRYTILHNNEWREKMLNLLG